MWGLVGNPEEGFSHNEAHFILVSATIMEPPVDILQGAEMSGRGAPQQYERESNTV